MPTASTPDDEPCFVVEGDRLTPLTDGHQRLHILIDLIERAEHSLRLLYYIYCDDESGRRVREALLAAIGRGVRVSLIIDGFGSDAAESDFFAPLQEAGADFCRFHPRFGRRYLLRNHQKLALADERRALVGGFNVADDYFGSATSHAWRDLGLLVEGASAERLATYFDTLQAWVRNPKAPVRALRRALREHSEGTGRTRWLMGGPTRGPSPWARSVRGDIATASKVDMIAAYFAPNPAMIRPIERAARRTAGRTDAGARIITASQSDNNATIGAARHLYARLLRRGVRVAEYLPTKLHTKLFVIDDVVHIGSANYDIRSLYLNLEMMLRVEDAAFARHMREYFEGEWRDSREIVKAEHAKSGPVARLRWGLAYFLVAVMDFNVSRRLNFGFE